MLVSRELSRGLRWIRAVKGYYVTAAVLLGLLFLLLLGASASAPLLVGVGLVFTAAALGAFFVERAPLPWTIAVAALATVVSAWRLLAYLGASQVEGGDLGRGPGYLAPTMFLLTAAFWVAVSWARRYQACLEANAESIARRIDGSRVELEVEGIGTRHRDLARREELRHRRRRRMALTIGAGAFVAVVAVAGVVRSRSRNAEWLASAPAPAVSVEPALHSFERAWNENRVTSLEAMFVAESKDSLARQFERLRTQHAWSRLPAITRTRRTDEGEFAAAWFRLEGLEGEFYTSWAYDRAARTWGLNMFRMPRVKAGR